MCEHECTYLLTDRITFTDSTTDIEQLYVVRRPQYVIQMSRTVLKRCESSCTAKLLSSFISAVLHLVLAIYYMPDDYYSFSVSQAVFPNHALCVYIMYRGASRQCSMLLYLLSVTDTK